MRLQRSRLTGKRFVLTTLMSVAAFVLLTGQMCAGDKEQPAPPPVGTAPAAQAQADEPAPAMDMKNLTVESLNLAAPDGKIRASLATDANGAPAITFFDANGGARSRLTLDGAGNPFIDLYNSKGDILSSYWVEDDEPFLTYTDKDGKVVTVIPKDTAAPVRAASAGSGTVAKPATTDSNAGMSVYVINGRPNYHLRTCSRLEEKGKHPMTLADAVANGYGPCKVCRPPVLGAASSGGAQPAATAASAEPSVFVINGRPNYHLRTCARLESKGKHPMALSDAIANGYQPCKVCRPPVK